MTYNGNGSTSGAVPTDNNLYVSGLAANILNANTLAKTNARFLGWSTNGSASTPDYVAGDTLSMGSSNITLYAIWQSTIAGKYYISYDGNGSTSGSVPIDTTAYSSGNTLTVLDNLGGLTKPNYTFAGWNTKADGTGTTYDTVTSTTSPTFSISANTTLYAKWTVASTYKITYNVNGGAGAAPSDSHLYVDGQVATILGNSTGMTNGTKLFAGWNTNSSGTGDSYAANETLAMSGAMTLYAIWSDAYAITYNKNTTIGAPTGSAPTDSNSYVTNDNVTIKSGSGLSNTGYTFLGWNTSADGTGYGYSAGQNISMGATSLTLYAIWAANYYVSPNGSDTNNCLSMVAPCKTIGTALSKVTTSTGAQILLDKGTYSISTSQSLKTNVSILGGFDSSKNWARDILNNESLITNTASGSSSNCFTASNLNGFQKIEGITCQFTNGGSKTYYGVSVSTSPNTMIRYNKFKVGNVSATSGSGTYAGVYVTGKYISDITGNSFDGNNNGTVGKYTYGIKFNSLTSGSYFSVINNVINVGMRPTTSTSYPQAIDMSSSSKIIATIRNNTIYAGSAASGNSNATYGFGVRKGYKSSGYAKVKLYFDNNIVFGPAGQTGQYTYGVYCYSSYYCNVQSMKNNNFFTLKNFAKLGVSYSSIYNLELANAVATSNTNIEMVTNNYFKAAGSKNFKLDTSCPSEIKFGALDGYNLGWGYQNDLENQTNRTGNGTDDWSMGAYEQD